MIKKIARMLIPAATYNTMSLLKRLAKPPADPAKRFELLTLIGRRLVPEYRFNWPEMTWWNDAAFNAYLEKFNELNSMNSDRRWMLYQLLRLIGDVSGDTAECGVYAGASSYLICKNNSNNKQYRRQHYLFDSFEGLSEPMAEDGTHWSLGDLAVDLESVQITFQEFESVHYMKGWIPERFDEVADKRFAFVHIDVDLYEPTRNSIAFFYPRMNEGGILVCDDYMFNNCPGATKACDEFLADKPEKMITPSCGGGFLIKGQTVAKTLFHIQPG